MALTDRIVSGSDSHRDRDTARWRCIRADGRTARCVRISPARAAYRRDDYYGAMRSYEQALAKSRISRSPRLDSRCRRIT